jgi:hypothetical protein
MLVEGKKVTRMNDTEGQTKSHIVSRLSQQGLERMDDEKEERKDIESSSI